MDLEQKVLRAGAAALLCAFGIRLFLSGLPGKVLSFLTKPETAAFMIYLETGRVVRPAEITLATNPPTEIQVTQPSTEATTQPAFAQPEQPVFSRTDAAAVELVNVCGYQVDIPAMLVQELDWQLPGEAPSVLILHTHGSECYSGDGENYRSLDNRENMTSLGAAQLENAGILALHDPELHDQPYYNDAYVNARKAIQQHLQENPSVQLVLDLHRDAAEDAAGQQLTKSITVDGQQVAQLMLVVGTDASGLYHPDWEENMALAVKLQTMLERICPGICRPISFRTQRFNQDLSPGGLIVEVGAAGNTREEALRATEYLAQAIIALSYGTDAQS